MKSIAVNVFSTDWGTIRTAVTDTGLAIVALPGETRKYFDDQVAALAGNTPITTGGSINFQAEKQLREYLQGKRRNFKLKLEIQGTPFQEMVWREVMGIPYGKTRTYGDIARAIKRPRACRAVGSANGKNRLPLIIPCHRVVAVNGLGGFGGGLTLKKKLLRLEGAC